METVSITCQDHAFATRIPNCMTRRSKKTEKSRHPTEPAVELSRPLLSYLRGSLESLQSTDRTIADRVLEDPEKIVTSSISEVREACGVSVGSIVGFCRRLGLTGFADFKIALARDLAQAGLSSRKSPQNGSLFEKVFHFHSESLIETLQLNPASLLERIAQVLEKARKIEFFSIGLSYPVAYTAASKFLLIGMQASAQADSHMQLISATQLRAGDVAFGISCSGTTRETVQCLEVAKDRGATTVCLTNAVNSPITLPSDMCLHATPSEIKYFQAPLASRITQLALIDALFVALASKHRNKTAGLLQQSVEELVKRRLK
jgi:DNA-binding MurR/RpiR family transcriptional regulator